MTSNIDDFCGRLLAITGALILGCLVFLGVLSLVVFSNGPQLNWDFDHPLTLVALAVLLPGMVMSVVVPKILMQASLATAKKSNMDGEQKGLEAAKQAMMTSTIVKFALMEGGVFFSIVAFFLTTSWIPLILAGMGIALMVARIPWPHSVRWQVEEFLTELKRS